MDNRQQLRRTLKAQRLQLPRSVQIAASKQIARLVIRQPWFQRSQHIAFYMPVNGEVDPDPLMQQAWKMGKTCYLPVLHAFKPNYLSFTPYHPGQRLIPNRYGIPEPIKPHPYKEPYALDLVFAPLVAFDDQGNRLGMGCGYYDRTFARLNSPTHRHKPLLVGLAYAFQKVPTLKPEPWDVPLDQVITENSYMPF